MTTPRPSLISRRHLVRWSVTALLLAALCALAPSASADEFNTNTAGGTGGDQFNTNTVGGTGGPAGAGARTCHQSARGPQLRAQYGEPTIIPIVQLSQQTGALYVICTGDDCRNDVADCWGHVPPPDPSRTNWYEAPVTTLVASRPLEGRTEERRPSEPSPAAGVDPFVPQQPVVDNGGVRPPVTGQVTNPNPNPNRRRGSLLPGRVLTKAKQGRATLIIPEGSRGWGFFEPIDFTLPAGKPYGQGVSVDIKINKDKNYFYISVTGDLTQGKGAIDTFRITSATGKDNVEYTDARAVTVTPLNNGSFNWSNVPGGAIILK